MRGARLDDPEIRDAHEFAFDGGSSPRWRGRLPGQRGWFLRLRVLVLCASVLLGFLARVVQHPAGHLVQSRPALQIPPGFASGGGDDPRQGVFKARVVTLTSAGYANDAPGVTGDESWTLARVCQPSCTYQLTRVLRQTTGYPFLTADLVRHADGWEAIWPAVMAPCGGNSLDPIVWAQREVWKLRFTDGGGQVIARAAKFSYNPRCGYGRDTAAWQAKLAVPIPVTSPQGPSVARGRPS